MSEQTLTGGCRCGAVRFVAGGRPRWVAHCHCADCRRITASPFTTFVGMTKGDVAWMGVPQLYRSSPGVVRTFCGTCGTPLAFEGERWPDETHLYAATLDDPAAVTPAAHVHVAEQLPWIHLADGLPRYRKSGGAPAADP